jgi:hypothetical protein
MSKLTPGEASNVQVKAKLSASQAADLANFAKFHQISIAEAIRHLLARSLYEEAAARENASLIQKKNRA